MLSSLCRDESCCSRVATLIGLNQAHLDGTLRKRGDVPLPLTGKKPVVSYVTRWRAAAAGKEPALRHS